MPVMTPAMARLLAQRVQRPVLKYWRHLPSLRWFAEREAELARPPRRDVRAEPLSVQGPDCRIGGLRLVPRNAVAGRRLLYVHGGGFVLGSAVTHRALASALAVAAESEVLLPNYRLAPEHPYPAAIRDLRAAWEAMEDAGERLLAGDSAGGTLALSLAQILRDQEAPGPAAIGLISPVADMSLSASEVVSRAESDLLIPPDWGAASVASYLGGVPADDPRVSPLHGSVAGLPPIMVQAAGGEILESDARRVVAAVAATGGSAELEVWPGLPHVWQIHAGQLAEADSALRAMGRFLIRRGGAS